ncbi:hypothetical protein C8Q79DRAFT_990075 [Trametes meyenii]|nr:hypothetical protein C8Q79DRAFT_990075 [Trametes meyenii]
MVVNENDPRFRYGPGWIVDSNDPSGDHNTTHFSMMNGSYAVVSFTGTSITVFGILERSNATSITATFSLDGDEPVRSTLPATSSPCLHNQAFFQSMQLRNTNHNLTINVTNVHNIPFILDYVWLCSGTQTSSNADLKPSASAKPQTSRFSRYDGIIVGSVLGGVFLVLGLAALAWFCIRRRNRRRQLRQLNIAASPVSSWLHRQQNSSYSSPRYPSVYHSYDLVRTGGSGGTEIVFTSTESIMRDNPEYSGSEGSKTGPNHLLSLPITSAFNSPEMPPGLGLSNLSPYAAGPDHSAGLAPPPWTVQGRVR